MSLPQGVPLRIELGPKDLAAGQAVAVRRDTGEKAVLKRDGVAGAVSGLLEQIHHAMFKK